MQCSVKTLPSNRFSPQTQGLMPPPLSHLAFLSSQSAKGQNEILFMNSVWLSWLAHFGVQQKENCTGFLNRLATVADPAFPRRGTEQEAQLIRCVFEHISQFWLCFTMVVFEKIYFEAYRNDQYIWHKNNIAQLYFILWRAKLCWNFSRWLRDVPNIYRFPTVHMVKTHFLLENLWISKPSLPEKSHCRLASLI